ncbi:hypothetical protein EG329_004220 [Mollisiaceae sp. DMI_Dod_QoI]|nr:hypothetical protein EG329_004220 [Helotiales sp. DMI_Dod_QoI]
MASKTKTGRKSESRRDDANQTPLHNPSPAINFPHALQGHDSALPVVPQTSTIEHTITIEPAKTIPTPGPGPLATFTCFPKLPMELQNRIWNHCARHGRFISLERDESYKNRKNVRRQRHHNYNPERESHFKVRISTKSLIVPVVLHVCHNSRKEANRVYEKRTFQPLRPEPKKPGEIQPDPFGRRRSTRRTRVRDEEEKKKNEKENAKENAKEHPFVYYNPLDDVVLFSDQSCEQTMREVFLLGQEIPRVAFYVDVNGRGCDCGGDRTHRKGQINVLKTLHGVNRHLDPKSGCAGLKDVLMIVKSGLWDPMEHGNGWNSVTWRPASGNGKTREEVIDKERLDVVVENCKKGLSLWDGVEDAQEEWNMWVEDKLPDFQYVSFAPVAKENSVKVLDGIVVSQFSIMALRTMATPEFLEGLLARTGCQFFIPEADDSKQCHGEVGLYGTKPAIQKAKLEIKALAREAILKGASWLANNPKQKINTTKK